MSQNKRHLLHEVETLKDLGAMQALLQDERGVMSYLSQIAAITHREGIPAHFIKDLEKIQQDDFMLERAREQVHSRHRDLTPASETLFVTQQQRFYKIDACQAILEGVEQYLKADESFHIAGSISEHIKVLKKAVRDKKTLWRRWIGTFVTLFEKKVIPAYPQHHKELKSYLDNFKAMFDVDNPPTKEQEKEFIKRAEELMDDIEIFFHNYCEGVPAAALDEPAAVAAAVDSGLPEITPSEMSSDTILK